MTLHREPDYLERAEQYAAKLAGSKSSRPFAHMNTGLRALAIAFAEELEKRDRRIAALEAKQHSLRTSGDAE